MALQLDMFYRVPLGRKLTNSEVDTNFSRLATACGQLEQMVGEGNNPQPAIDAAIAAHVAQPNPHTQYLIEAPNDNKTYGRRNQTWVETGGLSRLNTSISTATSFVPDYYVVRDNCGVVFEHVAASYANNPSKAVIPAGLFHMIGGLDDQEGAQGGNRLDGHIICVFNLTSINTPIDFAIGQEIRLNCNKSKVKEFIATQHVIQPTNQGTGTCDKYVLENFNDMRSAVTHIGKFTREFLDPRIITTHAGGTFHAGDTITASRMLTLSDAGKSFMVNANSNVTLTIPRDWPAGAQMTFVQSGAGKIIIALESWDTNAMYSRGDRVQTEKLLDEVTIRSFQYGAIVLTFNLG